MFVVMIIVTINDQVMVMVMVMVTVMIHNHHNKDNIDDVAFASQGSYRVGHWLCCYTRA